MKLPAIKINGFIPTRMEYQGTVIFENFIGDFYIPATAPGNDEWEIQFHIKNESKSLMAIVYIDAPAAENGWKTSKRFGGISDKKIRQVVVKAFKKHIAEIHSDLDEE